MCCVGASEPIQLPARRALFHPPAIVLARAVGRCRACSYRQRARVQTWRTDLIGSAAWRTVKAGGYVLEPWGQVVTGAQSLNDSKKQILTLTC